MAKPPTVIGVLTEPTPPGWWKTNRHRAFLILGLIGGYLIGTHASDAAPHPAHPRPVHTAPADPSTRPTPATSGNTTQLPQR